MPVKLSVGNSPLADWTLTEALKEMGYGKALEEGTVKVADDGKVTVAKGADVAFSGYVQSEAELKKIEAALGKTAGPPATLDGASQGDGPKISDVILRTRASRFENRVNEYIWYGVKLQTDLKEEYRLGQRFDMPLTRLPPGEGEIITVADPPAMVEKMKDYFQGDDGSILAPVHPQEMPFRGIDKADETLAVRCASSERTLHASVPGVKDAMIKLDLANIMHSGVYRPVDKTAAQASMAVTEFLMDWLKENQKPDDTLAVFPEVMAIIDKGADAASIVRNPEPYPPPRDGQRVWSMPMYCLSARDQDFPDEPPPMVRMVRDRPDKSVSEKEYFEEKFLRPLIDSALRVHVDLASSCQAHGQNTALEVGEDGQPTGRIIHQDLEAFWPHPDAAKAAGRRDFFDEYGFVHNPDAKEAEVYGTFQAYFYSQNLRPLVKCFAEHFPDAGSAYELQKRADEIIQEGVLARKDTVEALKDGPLEGFYKAYVAGSGR